MDNVRAVQSVAVNGMNNRTQQCPADDCRPEKAPLRYAGLRAAARHLLRRIALQHVNDRTKLADLVQSSVQDRGLNHEEK